MSDTRTNEQDPQDAAAAPDTSTAEETSASERTAPGADDTLEALRREKDAMHERLLRTAAEFDNYRKRIDRERRDLAEAAAADLLADLLPVVDDLERALQAPAGGDAESYRRGVELILKQLRDVLRRRGVRPIEAVGQDFDPRYHESVMQEVSPAHREGEVLQELRRGYMLGDRLLRAAMVKVAKGE